MSAPLRILCTLALTLPPSSQSSSSAFKSRTFLFLRSPLPYITLARSLSLTSSFSLFRPIMPHKQRRGEHRDQTWKEKPKTDMQSATGSASAAVGEDVSSRIRGLSIAESTQKVIWQPKSY